jgi:ribosome biogenesis protein Tsr3
MRAGGPAAAAAEARLSDALDRSVALLVSLVVANPVNYARNLPLRLDTGEPLAAVMEFEQCRVAAREMGLSQQQVGLGRGGWAVP